MFFNLYCTTFAWFSLHFWIKRLLYVLSLHWITLILRNVVLRMDRGNYSTIHHNTIEHAHAKVFISIDEHYCLVGPRISHASFIA
jgi:hypothetical protein